MKFLLCCTLVCLACRLDATEGGTLKLIQTIPLPGVKGRFDHFAIDIKGQHLFVAAPGNNTLEVIDLAAGKRLQSVTGMSKPTGVLYLLDANEVFVGNGDDGTLKVLRGTDYKVLHNLKELADADNLRFDPTTKSAWLGYGEGALGIIDTTTAKLVGSVKLPAHPESFQLEKLGTRIYVNMPDTKQVAMIDRVKRAIIETWRMETFQANFAMALDELNHRLFIGCRQPARLVVLDTTTGKSITDLAISGDIDDLFFDAVRKRLYLSGGEGFIDTIQQSTPNAYKLLSKLPSAPGARTAFFSPELDRLYLAVPDRGSQKPEIRVYQPD
jgi:DNA-binding beta-propeller fold protein YncE